MTIASAIALLLAMSLLAALPSASVALVVTRAATLGIANGAAVALGIVLGDLVFVALAIMGMSFLAETLGSLFVVVKCAGGAYLVWLGVNLLRAERRVDSVAGATPRLSLLASFAAGLVLTLGDVKAILFYASFFPAFVDMAALTPGDIATIAGLTILSVGGIKLAYAVAARRIVGCLRARTGRGRRLVRTAAGGCMIGAGTCLIAKA